VKAGKGKALPVETVTIATQTHHTQEPRALQVDDGIQTEVLVEDLEKGRAKDSKDTVMKDRQTTPKFVRRCTKTFLGMKVRTRLW